jgi:hypothetical protein
LFSLLPALLPALLYQTGRDGNGYTGLENFLRAENISPAFFGAHKLRAMRLLHSSQSPAGVRSAEISAIVASLSETQLRKWVEKIAVPRHFVAQREANRATANWIAEYFAELGHEVKRQGQFENIIALPRKKCAGAVLVGAHYDSKPETPGADDNGSAVAAMLGCADALAKFAPEAPVCFAAFNCEEDGMLGSADFVETFLPDAGFKVAEAHMLEMVGYASAEPGSQRVPPGLPISLPDKGDFLGILANRDSGGIMEEILRDARTYLPEFSVMALEVVAGAERVFPVLARSDHVPFWNRKTPAVMWTDTSEFRNRNYHQPTDTPQTLDYGFFRRVTQLLVAHIAAQVKNSKTSGA